MWHTNFCWQVYEQILEYSFLGPPCFSLFSLSLSANKTLKYNLPTVKCTILRYTAHEFSHIYTPYNRHPYQDIDNVQHCRESPYVLSSHWHPSPITIWLYHHRLVSHVPLIRKVMGLHWPFMSVPVTKFSKMQHSVTPDSEVSIWSLLLSGLSDLSQVNA